jgi:hypothetical protein
MVVWLIRAGRYGQDEDLALEKNLAIIGWEELGDLSKVKSREDPVPGSPRSFRTRGLALPDVSLSRGT